MSDASILNTESEHDEADQAELPENPANPELGADGDDQKLDH